MWLYPDCSNINLQVYIHTQNIQGRVVYSHTHTHAHIDRGVFLNQRGGLQRKDPDSRWC